MKRTETCLAFLLGLALASCGPAEPASAGEAVPPAPSDPVDSIRQTYAAVQAVLDAGTLRADTLRETCRQQDGELFLVRYFDGDRVRMMRATTGTGHAFTTRRLYFDTAGRLVFALVQDEQFRPVTAPGGEPSYESTYTDTRYYVSGGRVIRKLVKTYEEQDWADNPDPETLPNTEVTVPETAKFPDSDRVADWKAGRVDC
ncbi:hypothetical protein [Lewinella sp. IMCC34183]|uniref:hypothetical protein n=1 Tax=Lewinella sp. IMCC34183 TaxID=2248762 RepID=UPI001300AE5E|nr:hypothetical protein [Lewinella sp. IMCC34183]